MKSLLTKLSYLLIVVATTTFASAKSDHTYPLDVPLTAERTINFDVQEGEFILRGDPAAKSVHMEVSIDRFFIFRLGEQDILKRLIKVSHPDSVSVTIATDIPTSITNWGRAQYPIDFKIVVPAYMTIRLHDTSGIIKISDLTGDVAIEDSSGTIAVNRLGGNLQITKESGDIHVRQVKGKTRINNRSGQMRFESVGSLEIDRSDGNLFIAGVGPATIRNDSGNIRVFNVKGALVLHDTSGEIVLRDVDGSAEITDTSGQIRAANTGTITIRDTDGNVTVENATSLDVTEKESGEVIVRNVGGQVHVPQNIRLKQKG